MSTGAVIFDMDGTLTLPQFDFDEIRREIGLSEEPLLEAIVLLPPEQRQRAETILHRYEAHFAATSTLRAHAREVVTRIRGAAMPCALMTRNSRASVDVFLSRHGLEFEWVWTRESGPSKPLPDAVFHICEQLHALPVESWVVGDYLYDLQCGRAAGARTMLVLGDAPYPVWADLADAVVSSLSEIPELLGL